MSHVLIVDDEPTICWTLEQALLSEGHAVTTTASAEAALGLVREKQPDVIVMDIRLPGLDGLCALEQLKAGISNAPVVIITAFGNLETAVRAIHQGAFEYLVKPFDLDQAMTVIGRAMEPASRKTESTPLHEGHGDQLLLGRTPEMQQIFRRIAMVADRDVPVLITGESGTGKELVAQAIHAYSQRAGGPFVATCLPAMNDNLVESELFGHVRGAYTGADEKRVGMFETADGGTIFLDEIGDVSQTLQVKLLRVLESKMITPVGSNQAKRSDFRLIAATNRSLETFMQEGRFREDLFHRLNVFRIELPALRERRGDIGLLAEHFVRQIDDQMRLSEEAMRELVSREWVGNVRELKNVIEHAVILTRSGTIGPHSFPPPMKRQHLEVTSSELLSSAVKSWWNEQIGRGESSSDLSGLFDEFMQQVEPVLFEQALELTKGNRGEAASVLGIHRQTLREKLKRYGQEG